MKSEIAEVLNQLAKKHKGRITPEIVVEAARDPESPLHAQFEWDDESAAHSWRIEQARRLIRSTDFVVRVGESKVMLPVYVRDPEQASKSQGYVMTSALRSDKDLARDVLIEEFARANAALKRARGLAKYFAMADQVEDIIGRVDTVLEQVRETEHAPA